MEITAFDKLYDMRKQKNIKNVEHWKPVKTKLNIYVQV